MYFINLIFEAVYRIHRDTCRKNKFTRIELGFNFLQECEANVF